ncbi:hypothetical protein AAFN90_19620 [Erwiniaceae bacterium CAU 1747]
MGKNNDNPLGKEHILNELWAKGGLACSGNNLNVYKPILHKVLVSLGFSDLMFTISRDEFMFNSELDFKK